QAQIGNAFVSGSPQGTINFGATEGIIFANNSFNNFNVDTFVSGSGGVTAAGQNSLTWNTGASAYTGGTTLNSGGIIPTGSGAFTSGPLPLAGGSFNPNAALVFSNPINLSGAVTFAGAAAAASFYTGPMPLTSNVLITPAVNVTLNGSI